jgi:predicted chitinase
MTRVTADDLRRIASKGDSAILAGLAPSLSVTLARYGIATPLRFAHFIAQAAHEKLKIHGITSVVAPSR